MKNTEAAKRGKFVRCVLNGSVKMSRQQLEELKLRRAMLESYQTGRLTPILKEELKYHIQSRRLSEGKTELVLGVERGQNMESPQLSPDEVARRNMRKEQNRTASRKFRKRKRSEIEGLVQLRTELEAKNAELKKSVERLQAEKDAVWDEVTSVLQHVTKDAD
ncbi:cyclic AMP-dependent transcription factor ATF-3-like [Mya arenaria]|nr:cyclic AMP-dependent transcription factor ATF-3-like [Mya arenaria]